MFNPVKPSFAIYIKVGFQRSQSQRLFSIYRPGNKLLDINEQCRHIVLDIFNSLLSLSLLLALAINYQ